MMVMVVLMLIVCELNQSPQKGHYLNDCMLEFPREWYEDALDADKLRPAGPDIKINAFESKSRQPLQGLSSLLFQHSNMQWMR
jgi:hypothetical protein